MEKSTNPLSELERAELELGVAIGWCKSANNRLTPGQVRLVVEAMELAYDLIRNDDRTGEHSAKDSA